MDSLFYGRENFCCVYGGVLSQRLRPEDTVCNLSLLTTVNCVFELSLDCGGTAIKIIAFLLATVNR
jgi:hypothetical protein